MASRGKILLMPVFTRSREKVPHDLQDVSRFTMNPVNPE
jgi:hypothetical protein